MPDHAANSAYIPTVACVRSCSSVTSSAAINERDGSSRHHFASVTRSLPRVLALPAVRSCINAGSVMSRGCAYGCGACPKSAHDQSTISEPLMLPRAAFE